MRSSQSRALLAVCGIACSLLANLSGEVYRVRGHSVRHHRAGQNCRTARYALGDTDHAHELDGPRQQFLRTAGEDAQSNLTGTAFEADLAPIAVSELPLVLIGLSSVIYEPAEYSGWSYPPSAARPPPSLF